MKNSHEIEEIMGKIPSVGIRYGVVVITLVFTVILITTYFVKYPTITKLPIEIYSNSQNNVTGLVCLSKEKVDLFKVGQPVVVRINTYKCNTSETITGTIETIMYSVKDNEFVASVAFNTNSSMLPIALRHYQYIWGEAAIKTDGEKLLFRISNLLK